MVRDLLSWLVSGKSDKSNRSHITNLKVVERRLERSKKKLENKERQNERKIRTALQKGDMEAARLYANDVVRSRKWARGYQSLVSKIDGLIFKLERTDAVQSLAGEMRSVANSLREASAALNMEGLDDTVKDLESTMENVDIASDMMEDSVDGLFSADIDESEVDNLLGEYGAEVGVTASTGLPTAPVTNSKVSDLENEIEQLRKDE